MNITNHMRGLVAELYVLVYLFVKGYGILAWRFKTSVGEIDIIAEKRGVIVCIEVKQRASMDDALAAVTPLMRKRIISAAKMFLSRNRRFMKYPLRFDVASVSGLRILHLDNAWMDDT